MCKSSYVPDDRTVIVKRFFAKGDANFKNVSVFSMVRVRVIVEKYSDCCCLITLCRRQVSSGYL